MLLILRGNLHLIVCLFRFIGGARMTPVDVPIQGRVAGLERQAVSPSFLDAVRPCTHGARIDVTAA